MVSGVEGRATSASMMLMRFRVEGTCSSPALSKLGSVRNGTINATFSGSSVVFTARIT